MTISLKAGWNYALYTGREQPAYEALASIPYCRYCRYWRADIQQWQEFAGTAKMMIPYECYSLYVTQDCYWDYGPDEIPPTSIYLYRDWNYFGVGLDLEDTRIETVLRSIEGLYTEVWHYLKDIDWWSIYVPDKPPEYYEALGMSKITNIEYRKVYQIRMLQAATLELVEVPPEVVPCEIIINAPRSAAEGETVNASVQIKNVSPYHYSYKATIYAVPDRYPDYVIGEIDQVITSGSSAARSTPFTMPDCNVTIFVLVERWSFDRWVYDNSDTKVVSLEVPATFHLDVHVPPWAAGGYVEPGSGDYEAYSTVTLTAHPLSGYQFTGWGGDASGTDLTYNLYMNSDKYVEAYFEPVPVPEYEGSIITKELEYDETRSNIPVY